MRADPPAGDPGFQRLHPSSLLFSFLGHAKRLLLPAILVLLFASGQQWQTWLVVLFVPTMLFEVYRYFGLSFRITGGELILKEGLVFTNERHIPFARIQNVGVSQNVLARLLGVAEVRLETGSGEEPEAILKVLTEAQIREIKERVGASASPAALEGERSVVEIEPLVRLSIRDLVILGMNPGRGVAVVAILGGIVWELNLFAQMSLSFGWARLFDRSSLGLLAAGALVLVLAVPLLLLLLGTLWTILRLYDFTLTRRGENLHVECGLLTRRTSTVPRCGIQFVAIHESPLFRWFGRVSVRIETAGRDEEQAEVRSWFAPLLRRADLGAVLRAVDSAVDLDRAAWRSLAPAARRRMRKQAVIVSVALATGAAVFFSPWAGLSIGVLLPTLLAHADREWRFTAWAQEPYGVLFRSGAWKRTWRFTFHDRIQAITLSRSPFDRRWRMASLAVDTAGAGTAGPRIEIPHLGTGAAVGLRRRLVEAAERTTFHW